MDAVEEKVNKVIDDQIKLINDLVEGLEELEHSLTNNNVSTPIRELELSCDELFAETYYRATAAADSSDVTALWHDGDNSKQIEVDVSNEKYLENISDTQLAKERDLLISQLLVFAFSDNFERFMTPSDNTKNANSIDNQVISDCPTTHQYEQYDYLPEVAEELAAFEEIGENVRNKNMVLRSPICNAKQDCLGRFMVEETKDICQQTDEMSRKQSLTYYFNTDKLKIANINFNSDVAPPRIRLGNTTRNGYNQRVEEISQTRPEHCHKMVQKLPPGVEAKPGHSRPERGQEAAVASPPPVPLAQTGSRRSLTPMPRTTPHHTVAHQRVVRQPVQSESAGSSSGSKSPLSPNHNYLDFHHASTSYARLARRKYNQMLAAGTTPPPSVVRGHKLYNSAVVAARMDSNAALSAEIGSPSPNHNSSGSITPASDLIMNQMGATNNQKMMLYNGNPPCSNDVMRSSNSTRSATRPGYLPTQPTYSTPHDVTSPPGGSLVLSPGSHTSAAASFFARAAQKLNFSSRKKKKQQMELDTPPFPTNFCDVIRLTPPAAPPGLLRPGGRGIGPASVGKVKVLLRVCPIECQTSGQSVLSVDPRRKQLVLHDPSAGGYASAMIARSRGVTAPKMFAFDSVVSADDSMTELCSCSLTEVVQSVVSGADGCLFCYGHSRVGKTYSMIGVDDHPSNLGIIPCAISWLFKLIEEQKERTGARFSVRVSAVEVTGKQETLKDLLADIGTGQDANNAPGVYLRDDPHLGAQLENQSELRAPTAEKAAYFLDAAIGARTVPEVEEDARHSHLLFTLHVYQYKLDKAAQTKSGLGQGVAGGRSRLHLLDLGSCNKSSRDQPGQSLTLAALGNVILALLNGQRHIPHRESKLTQLVKDALGGPSTRCVMLAHCSANVQAYNETLQVVQLASKIHRLKVRRNKTGRFSGGSSEESSSCDEQGRVRRVRTGIRMGTLRETALYNSALSSQSDPSESELSCDTVIYVAPTGKALSDHEITDNEAPPRSLPLPLSASETRSRARSSGDETDSSRKFTPRCGATMASHVSRIHSRTRSPGGNSPSNKSKSCSPAGSRTTSTSGQPQQHPPVTRPAPGVVQLPRKINIKKHNLPQPPPANAATEMWIDGPAAGAHMNYDMASVSSSSRAAAPTSQPPPPPQWSPVNYGKPQPTWMEQPAMQNVPHVVPVYNSEGVPVAPAYSASYRCQNAPPQWTNGPMGTSHSPNNNTGTQASEHWIDGPAKIQTNVPYGQQPMQYVMPPHMQPHYALQQPQHSFVQASSSQHHQQQFPSQSPHQSPARKHHPHHPAYVQSHQTPQSQLHHNPPFVPQQHFASTTGTALHHPVEKTNTVATQPQAGVTYSGGPHHPVEQWPQSVTSPAKRTIGVGEEAPSNMTTMSRESVVSQSEDSSKDSTKAHTGAQASAEDLARQHLEVLQKLKLKNGEQTEKENEMVPKVKSFVRAWVEQHAQLARQDRSAPASPRHHRHRSPRHKPAARAQDDIACVRTGARDLKDLAQSAQSTPRMLKKSAQSPAPPSANERTLQWLREVQKEQNDTGDVDDDNNNARSVPENGDMLNELPEERKVLMEIEPGESHIINIQAVSEFKDLKPTSDGLLSLPLTRDSIYEHQLDDRLESNSVQEETWRNSTFTSEEENQNVMDEVDDEVETANILLDDVTVPSLEELCHKSNQIESSFSQNGNDVEKHIDEPIETQPTTSPFRPDDINGSSKNNLIRPSCLRRPDGASNPNLSVHSETTPLSESIGLEEITKTVSRKLQGEPEGRPPNMTSPLKSPKISESPPSPLPKTSSKSSCKKETVNKLVLASPSASSASTVSSSPTRTKTGLFGGKCKFSKSSTEKNGRTLPENMPKNLEKLSKIGSFTNKNKDKSKSANKNNKVDKVESKKQEKSSSRPTSAKSTSRLPLFSRVKSPKPSPDKSSKATLEKTAKQDKNRNVEKQPKNGLRFGGEASPSERGAASADPSDLSHQGEYARSADSDSGNDSGIVVTSSTPETLSPYKKASKVRVSTHSSGHGSDVSFSSHTSPHASPGVMTSQAEQQSSGYESVNRDSEIGSSSQDTNSESSAPGRSKSTPTRVTALPTKMHDIVDLGEEQHVEIKQLSDEDVARLQRRRTEDVAYREKSARRDKVRELISRQATLRQDFVDTKQLLMVDPDSWSFDLYVAEQMNRDDEDFVAALEKETEILEKRLLAAKSRIMMVTVFDVNA